jgi:CubicO group peptidase (beta-lactamase class C family)
VERVSGLSLNDYFQKNIFKPMGLQAINFFPTDHMKQNLAYMHARAPDGKLSLRLNGQLLRKPLTAKTTEEIKATFNTGGAGCFAKPAEYCQIIATLLNDGVHAKSGHRLLRKETVDQMFTNQVRSKCMEHRLQLTQDRSQSSLTSGVKESIRQSQTIRILFRICTHKATCLKDGD